MDLLYIRKNGFFDFIIIDIISYLVNVKRLPKYEFNDFLLNLSENSFYYLFILLVMLLNYKEENRKNKFFNNDTSKILSKLSLMIINVLKMLDLNYFQSESIKMIEFLYFICNFNILKQALSK